MTEQYNKDTGTWEEIAPAIPVGSSPPIMGLLGGVQRGAGMIGAGALDTLNQFTHLITGQRSPTVDTMVENINDYYNPNPRQSPLLTPEQASEAGRRSAVNIPTPEPQRQGMSADELARISAIDPNAQIENGQVVTGNKPETPTTKTFEEHLKENSKYMEEMQKASLQALNIVRQVTGITPGQMSNYYTMGPGKSEYATAMGMYGNIMKAWETQNKPENITAGGTLSRPGIGTGTEKGQGLYPKYTAIPGTNSVVSPEGKMITAPNTKENVDRVISIYGREAIQNIIAYADQANKYEEKGQRDKITTLHSLAQKIVSGMGPGQDMSKIMSTLSTQPAIFSSFLSEKSRNDFDKLYGQAVNIGQGGAVPVTTPTTEPRQQNTMTPVVSPQEQQVLNSRTHLSVIPPGSEWRKYGSKFILVNKEKVIDAL